MKYLSRYMTVLLLATILFVPKFSQLSELVVKAQEIDWSWLSADLDGDGLSNQVERDGWCNTLGCFQTAVGDPDSDGDGLKDGEEKLFESDPNDDASPGIYVVYEDAFKTREYYPWQQYGNKLIARGDEFDPPNPDSIDASLGRRQNLDAVVVRRGTTFSVGGVSDETLQISKWWTDSLTTLSSWRDPYSGRWRVNVPSYGTVGKYTLRLGDHSLDLFVIFELPTPSGELTQKSIEKFLYDDDPTTDADQISVLIVDTQFDYDYGFVSQGTSYVFENEQYNRYLLEDYVIQQINGYTTQRGAANALARFVDRMTVFRNPRPFIRSWRVLNPGVNPRQQCSSIAGLLSAVNRTIGIPSRPVMTDWRNNTFDHANEIWLGGWRAYRGYVTFEMEPEPDDTHTGCAEGIWPQCGSYQDYSRYDWGRYRYRPWHSGGGGNGNVIVLADENWTSTGLAYRWPSWDVDTINLDPTRFMTQNSEYWTYWGWWQEPVNRGWPGWPSAPYGASAEEAGDFAGETDFQSTEVQLGDVVAEYGVDTNGNGQYDQLVLDVQVTAAQPGSYWLLGQIGVDYPEPRLLEAGGLIAQALTPVALVEGTQVVPLIFGGPSISLNRVDGPYTLTGVWAAGSKARDLVDFMNDSLAYRKDVYVTTPYRATDFETYGAMLSDEYEDDDLDSDGDGRSDALLIRTGIQVYQPGTYTVQGSLYDSQGEFVATATWTGNGAEVTLQFDRMAGTYGPYTLQDLDLLNADGESVDYLAQAYTIGAVSALASPERITLDVYQGGNGFTIQSDAIAPTQVFTESLVAGNLVVETEVQVSEEGTFQIEAWLANADGELVTWSVGQPAHLPVGQQILSLTFDGSAVRARGLAGPYTVVALKVRDADEAYVVLDKVDVALTTRAYTLDQFSSDGPIVALEDFVENGADKWVYDDLWAMNQYVTFSPSHAWCGDDETGSLAVSPPLNFWGIARPALRIQTSYDLVADGDDGYLQVSTDNQSWDTLAHFSGQGSWSTHVFDLNAYSGESTVYLRFHLVSGGNQSDNGWCVDDVLVAGFLDSDYDALSDEDELLWGTDPGNPDSDGDGLLDGDEIDNGTDPNDPDSDDDGLLDSWEVENGLDPLDGTDAGDDPDEDGLTNREENENHTDPNDADSDDDGLSDGDEITQGTDPLDSDSDDDGLSDGDEVDLGTDPLDPDSDDDGLSDGDEVDLGTDPLDPDSDGDGMPDGWEVDNGLDPSDGSDADDDSDGDGLSNQDEYENGSDPHDPDSDDDGLSDGDEVDLGIDPTDSDSDGDGLDDQDEVNRGTDPGDADSDDDGLNDGDEIDQGTDPHDPDSDDDGALDGDEIGQGSDPHDPDSDDDGILDGDDPTPNQAIFFRFMPIVFR